MFLFIYIFKLPLFLKLELKYDVGNKNLPKWVDLMYQKSPKLLRQLKNTIYTIKK